MSTKKFPLATFPSTLPSAAFPFPSFDSLARTELAAMGIPSGNLSQWQPWAGYDNASPINVPLSSNIHRVFDGSTIQNGSALPTSNFPILAGYFSFTLSVSANTNNVSFQFSFLKQKADGTSFVDYILVQPNVLIVAPAARQIISYRSTRTEFAQGFVFDALSDATGSATCSLSCSFEGVKIFTS